MLSLITKYSSPMTDQQFWDLLRLLDWKKLGNDDAVMRRFFKALPSWPNLKSAPSTIS